ncbi:MAG: hypothetical protein HY814_05230 [Candidatus Riflebacteria bacterium]|nr:hypothetical protein [Candidatus Riflebacteria bacterium]
MLTAPIQRRPAAVLWLILALFVLAWPAGLRGQCLPDEAIKQVKVTTPANFQQTTPFRTNRAQINIGFEHDGASGSYLARTEGADVNGSTFLPLPTDKTGNVGAGFNVDGIKQIGVIVLQQKCNLVVDSRASPSSGGAQCFVQYDTKPPVITVQSVTLGPNPPNLPTPYNGQTFTTNVDQLIVTGTVTDPDNGSPASEIKITVKNTGNNQTANATIDAATGTFTANVALSGINDGPLQLELVAEDKMTDPQATPNKSQATVIKIIRDKKNPSVQQVEIIRFNDDATRRQILTPGSRTFVGQETIFIRVTMSEQMASPPQVNVTQQGGVAIPAVLRQESTVNNTVFLYQYSVIPVEAQNGPARIQIQGQFDGGGPLPDFGYDLANNPIQAADTSATIANAFSVDTVSPYLLRLPTPPPPGQFASQPADGAVIGKNAFPLQIQVFVDDYNTSTRTDTNKTFASGVDFTSATNAAATGTTTGTGLTISLRGPQGDIPGTPSVSPPTGLFLILPDFTGSANSNPNFTDRDNDGKKEPLEGTYTITVGLIDKVANRATKTITFRVDTTPVSAESITATPQGCLRLQTGEFPPIVVTSRDTDFNVTATNVEFYSQIGGPNSVPVKFDTDPPQRVAATTPGTTATITVNGVRKPGQTVAGDQWPNPPTPIPADFLAPGELDPRVGANDGQYFTRVIPVDNAGNSGTISTTSGHRAAHVDFPVYIDNTDPYVERTHPLVDTPISGPLSAMEAVVVDPVASNGNAGCGIDVNQTAMSVQFEAAYQPNRVVNSFLEVPGTFPTRLRGRLRYIHIPNNTDPTRPDYLARDDRFRVLVELIDTVTGRVRSLPTDGSMDGIYSIAVNPTDRAGNSLDVSVLQPARLGQYFGLKPANDSTINLAQFFFLYDNIPPKLEIDKGRLAGANGKGKTSSEPRAVGTSGVAQGALIGARPFHIEGWASDLSAQGQTYGSNVSNHFGGADVDRVEYKLEVVDNQFLPIPAIPPSNGPKEGEIIPGKNNPVIPLTTAVLDPVQTPANSAIRSTTQPMDGAFAGTLRERRKFVIDDVLPPDDQILKPRTDTEGDFYLFTIRAIDRAGNVTAIQRRVSVDVNDIKPPALTAPADNLFTKSQVIQFKWGNVSGVKKFRFKLTFPSTSGKPVYTRLVEKTDDTDDRKNVVQLSLADQGLYKWSVASFDQVGNEGVASNEFRLNLDFTPPAILGNKATVTGDVQPTSRSGVLAIGQFNVRLNFSEPLKVAPWVSWQPASPSTTPIVLTTSSWTGAVFEAQGQIPQDADPKVFDGRASLNVGGVLDLAGNPMTHSNQTIIDGFEVDTGPAFQAKFFINPVMPAEMVLVVLASEELQQPPRFTELAGLTQVTNSSFRMSLNPRAYYTTLKLAQTKQAFNAQAVLSGTDLDGNVSRRVVRLSITPLKSTVRTKMIAQDLGVAIDVPAGAVEQDTLAYICPPVDAAAARSMDVPGMAKTGSAHADAPRGLVDLGPLADLQPDGLQFRLPATLTARLEGRPGISPSQLGIYQLVSGRWRFVGGRRPDGGVTGQLTMLAPLRVMADVACPEIVELSPSDDERLETGRPEISARLADLGSGVDPSGITISVDGQPLPFTFDEATGQAVVQLDRDLDPGKHSLEIAVRDRAGNPATPRKLGLVAPDHFGFSGPVLAAPNPVRNPSTQFVAPLTQPQAASKLVLDVYDAAGRRLRTLDAAGPFVGPRTSLDWDLLDDRGQPVSNGVYLFRARVTSLFGSKAQSKGKLAVLR